MPSNPKTTTNFSGQDQKRLRAAILMAARNLAVSSSQMRTFSDVAREIGSRCVKPALFEKRPATPSDSIFDVVDLFCGCGGTSAGFNVLNNLGPFFRLASALDIDANAVASYRANLGAKALCGDIFQLVKEFPDSRTLRKIFNLRPTKPLILIGCAPCQGFSAHRKKDKDSGLDWRNSLIAEFTKVAVRLMPEVVIMENVPEIITGKYHDYYDLASERLADAGYFLTSDVINMAEFGLPQKRFRAVIIASRWPVERLRGYLTTSEFRTVHESIGNLPPIEAGKVCASDPMHVTARHRAATIEVIRRVPKDGGSRPRGVGPKCLDRVKGFYDVYGRLHWNKPSITITAYARNPASGRYVHPNQNRGLSIREAAILQGFPRWYEFIGPFDDRYSQIGNAVPPLFATHLATHILGQLAGASLQASTTRSLAHA